MNAQRSKELDALAERIQDRVLESTERYQDELLFEECMQASRSMSKEEQDFLAGLLGVTP